MGKIFYIMGKSSSGKDTIYENLLGRKELLLHPLIMYTTRPIRTGETDGVQYHFVTEEQLKALEQAGKVIELRTYQTVYGPWHYFTADSPELSNADVDYLADYPMFGTIANINAFAIGAKMTNPRAKVYLDWYAKKGIDIAEQIRKVDPSCISGKDMVIPEEQSRFFGIYNVRDGRPHNLAMPLCHWGKFYERLIRTIMDGTWKNDDNTSKAINYWWGMSAGVVDVICSQNLPTGTQKLVELLKHTICAGEFNPFSGILYSQEGMVQSDPDRTLSPEEIIRMDWLAENVIGSIPAQKELTEQAKPVTQQSGLEN